MATDLKSLSLKELYNNKAIFSKVIGLMEQQMSYDYIIRYLNSKGYKMAKGNLTKLKKRIKESQEQNIPLEQLMDKREKNSIDDVDSNKIIGFTGKTNEPKSQNQQPVVSNSATGPVSKLYSEDQALEMIINKGMKTIEESEFIDPKTLMSALSLHAKYFGSRTRGLTAEALMQYQLIKESEMTALKEIFVRYIPKDKQEEALNEIDKRVNQIVNQIGATKDGKELIRQLQNAGLSLN